MKTKFIFSIIAIAIFFFLMRECDSQETTLGQFYYLAGTIAYAGLLIIIATKTNIFKKNEKNTL